ncbi:MAG: hypothetical protein ACJZ4A_01420 [Candidatus Pelagibacter sp.]
MKKNEILREKLNFELSKNYNSEYILEENKRLKSTIEELDTVSSEIVW